MRVLAIFLIVSIALLIWSSWRGPVKSIKQLEPSGLKYVRLRPIHEENWKQFRSRLTTMEIEFRVENLKKGLESSAPTAKPSHTLRLRGH